MNSQSRFSMELALGVKLVDPRATYAACMPAAPTRSVPWWRRAKWWLVARFWEGFYGAEGAPAHG